MPPSKKPAKPRARKEAPAKEPVLVERSSRVLTEIYAWRVTIHPQASTTGDPMRYLEFTSMDGKVGFRMMNIEPDLAQMMATMLVPEPTE